MHRMNCYFKVLCFQLALIFAWTSYGFSQEDRLILTKEDLAHGAHHLNHFEQLSKYASGFNLQVLKAIDSVQKHAIDGGSYFVGIKADPPESPVNYELKLGGRSMLLPARKSSYCSGSTYAAFIETLNLLYPDLSERLSEERYEALRMQEPEGGRRDDWIKFWGIWNADGFGCHFALVQYSQMGREIRPEDARPGDFANISWTSGNGHSVVILGWHYDENGQKMLMYWSSQTATNGYGDQSVPISKIKELKVVRLTNPENIFAFDVNHAIDRNVPGDKTGW